MLPQEPNFALPRAGKDKNDIYKVLVFPILAKLNAPQSPNPATHFPY